MRYRDVRGLACTCEPGHQDGDCERHGRDSAVPEHIAASTTLAAPTERTRPLHNRASRRKNGFIRNKGAGKQQRLRQQQRSQ